MIVGVRKLHFFAQPIRLVRFFKLQKAAAKVEGKSNKSRSFFKSWEQMHTEQANLILNQIIK